MNVTFKGLSPLGPLLGGLLAAGLGGSGALVACGVLILAVTALALTSPSLRNLHASADPVDEPTEPTAAGGAERPQPDEAEEPHAGTAEEPRLSPETVRHLHHAGIITTTASPATVVFSTLSDEEVELLTSLGARIKAASGADVTAHSTDSAEEGGDR